MSKSERCPKCGNLFDADRDHVIRCPSCHVCCSTACCIAGRGVWCFECEEEERDAEIAKEGT